MNTDLDVVVSLDQGLPDLAGERTIFGVLLQGVLVNFNGFLRLRINTSHSERCYDLTPV